MNKKKGFGINVGSSSILLIFVILCMVSFATLSIASANADYKLGKRVITRTSAYYEACNTAEKSIAEIDKTLWTIYESSKSKEDYFSTAGTSKSYIIPISDLQNLNITLEILYPEKTGDTCYRILSWNVVPNDSIEYDDTLPVPK